MTPKEKAEELADKFKVVLVLSDTDAGEEIICTTLAKQCALIAVDEIINTLNMDIRDVDVRGNILLDLIDWWQEVKKEIELL